MILGIGTDIVEIKRIKDSIVEHVLTKEENTISRRKICCQRSNYKSNKSI